MSAAGSSTQAHTPPADLALADSHALPRRTKKDWAGVDPAQRPATKRQMIVMTMLASPWLHVSSEALAAPRQHRNASQHPVSTRLLRSPAYSGSRTRREHDKEQTMLALQAITQGFHSLHALLIAVSVLIALFWRVALKIIFLLLVIATLITITLGAAAVLPLLAHVIK
jgi:hypothetical protein